MVQDGADYSDESSAKHIPGFLRACCNSRRVLDRPEQGSRRNRAVAFVHLRHIGAGRHHVDVGVARLAIQSYWPQAEPGAISPRAPSVPAMWL